MLFLKRKEEQAKQPSIEEVPRNFDGQVQVAVDQLKGIVEQVNIASMDLEKTSSSSKNQISILLEHSMQTAENTHQVTVKMSEIESSALHISAFSQEILSNSQTSNEELEISVESFQSLLGKFDALNKSHHILLQQMNQLVLNSKKIHDIVHTIGSISQKTRILALNASIEAARAGDHGKSFAVVANEVGNLAAQTSTAVEQTRENLELILNGINGSTNMVETETIQIEEGSNELKEILKSMHSFKSRLTSITSMVSESTESVEEQRENIQEISQLLQEISQLDMENKEHVHQVTYDLDKQHVNVQEIRSISTALTHTSEELQSLVNNDPTTMNMQIDRTVIDDSISILSNPIHAKELNSLHPHVHQKLLDGILSANAQLEAIWSNRLDGSFIYSNPTAALVNAKLRPWFIEASQGNTFVSDIYVSALTKKACITLSMPIQEGDKVIGVLGADLIIS
ncbi:methyl-accepting chemotaxis protein [Ureibacillus aquaedulcis]|uniref:Methyl-accepting chemotaxis protein n=1 Tax=Ureibacillus aquaedulcis TaxID=3058421 RepID=A0ABT8GQD9_9BACL|nr:methyl-accepting chemotaxis protein [Ureibacillus sp. BA0131]MDN4493629.1 methyl-accepting chemotaxis protein [Ureibacillus sp. BA0131]